MKLLPVLFLGAALVVAGCVSPEAAVNAAAADEADSAMAGAHAVHDAAGNLLDGASAGLVAAVGGAFHTGLPAAEPTIGVTSDGTVFMTANAANPSCAAAGGCPPLPYANFAAGPTLVRSQDGGQTWQDIFPKLPTGDSYKLRTWDPYVYVDPDTDRVFMDDIYPISCGFLSWSDDGGQSWGHNPYSCGNTNVNDHQTLVTATPRVLPTVGYDKLLYRCVNNVGYAACAISVDGGQTFAPQVPIGPTVGQNACAAITGHLEADAEGRVYLGLPCQGNRPGVLMTEDDGQTWSMSLVSEDLPLGGHDVDLAVDEAGNVYALFLSGGMPYFAVSRDHGATWSSPVMVAMTGVTASKFNAIAAGAPGKVAFAHVGTTIADPQDLPRGTCGALPALPCEEPAEWADATWNAYVGILEDALAPELVIQTVMANDPADPLARGQCAGRCHGMTDFIDIQIGADGRPWASFVDVCVAACVEDASVLFDGNLGLAATLLSGPALRGETAALVSLAPAAGT